jgi:hypothetical protein
MNDFIMTIMASVASSVAVGMLAAYLTAAKTMAVFKQRLDAVEAHASKNERAHDGLKEAHSRDGERLVRLETKIDMLLDRRTSE